MKKLGLFLLVFGLSVVWARSFPPKGVEYKNISAEEFFQLDLSSLKSATGYKVSDVYVNKLDNYAIDYMRYIYVKVSENDKEEKMLYAEDFKLYIKQKDSTFMERFGRSRSSVYKYNGHYTFWLYCKRGDIIVTDIEGIPTQEQLDADHSAYEAEKLAKWKAEEEAEKKAKAEKRKARNDKAKSLAKGYVYHGIDEDERNCKLFTGGALEEGHAYYISGFIVKYGGTMAAIDSLLFSARNSPVSVEYIDQKVKGEIVDAGLTSFFGKTMEIPLIVVVVGGKAPLRTPIVIGLIELE